MRGAELVRHGVRDFPGRMRRAIFFVAISFISFALGQQNLLITHDTKISEVFKTRTDLSTWRTLISEFDEELKALVNRTGNKITIFAPSNAALMTLDPLWKTDNLRRQQLLLHHVAPNVWTSDSLSSANPVGIKTLSGDHLVVAIKSTSVATSDHESVIEIDSRSHVSQADIEASDGVVHVIDQVLPPPDLPFYAQPRNNLTEQQLRSFAFSLQRETQTFFSVSVGLRQPGHQAIHDISSFREFRSLVIRVKYLPMLQMFVVYIGAASLFKLAEFEWAMLSDPEVLFAYREDFGYGPDVSPPREINLEGDGRVTKLSSQSGGSDIGVSSKSAESKPAKEESVWSLGASEVPAGDILLGFDLRTTKMSPSLNFPDLFVPPTSFFGSSIPKDVAKAKNDFNHLHPDAASLWDHPAVGLRSKQGTNNTINDATSTPERLPFLPLSTNVTRAAGLETSNLRRRLVPPGSTEQHGIVDYATSVSLREEPSFLAHAHDGGETNTYAMPCFKESPSFEISQIIDNYFIRQNVDYAWWGLRDLSRQSASSNAQAAWTAARHLSDDVLVAVIDSGVYFDHPELKRNMLKLSPSLQRHSSCCGSDGCNFRDCEVNPTPIDRNGHGTHVAGIIAGDGFNKGILENAVFFQEVTAVTPGGARVATSLTDGRDFDLSESSGVHPNAKILALRAIDVAEFEILQETEQPFPSVIRSPLQAVFEAIDFALAAKSRVINLSLGCVNAATCQNSQQAVAWEHAFKKAYDADIVVVVAAGNGEYSPNDPGGNAGGEDVDDPRTPILPRTFGFPNVLLAASSDRKNLKADFSNFGSQGVLVGAPGDDMWSTSVWYNRGALNQPQFLDNPVPAFEELRGTSQAAPVVSGIAALIRGECPGLSASEVVDVIRVTTRPTFALDPSVRSNCGKTLSPQTPCNKGGTSSGGVVDALAALLEAQRRCDLMSPPEPDSATATTASTTTTTTTTSSTTTTTTATPAPTAAPSTQPTVTKQPSLISSGIACEVPKNKDCSSLADINWSIGADFDPTCPGVGCFLTYCCRYRT